MSPSSYATTQDGGARSFWRPLKSIIAPFFEWFGELGIFCGRLARAAVTPPFEFGELLRQMDSIGSMSLPLVALAGAATGVVFA